MNFQFQYFRISIAPSILTIVATRGSDNVNHNYWFLTRELHDSVRSIKQKWISIYVNIRVLNIDIGSINIEAKILSGIGPHWQFLAVVQRTTRNFSTTKYFKITLKWISLCCPIRKVPYLCSYVACFNRGWSSCIANSDKKYMELNGAALDVNKTCVWLLGKQPFQKISRGKKWKIVVTLL